MLVLKQGKAIAHYSFLRGLPMLYSSFGPTDLSNDPYKVAMEKAWDDGRSMAKEGYTLNLAHVQKSLRQSFKRGYYNLK